MWPLGRLVPMKFFLLKSHLLLRVLKFWLTWSLHLGFAKIFSAMLCHLKSCLFIFFSFFVVMMSMLICYLLLETKCIQTEETGTGKNLRLMSLLHIMPWRLSMVVWIYSRFKFMFQHNLTNDNIGVGSFFLVQKNAGWILNVPRYYWLYQLFLFCFSFLWLHNFPLFI